MISVDDFRLQGKALQLCSLVYKPINLLTGWIYGPKTIIILVLHIVILVFTNLAIRNKLRSAINPIKSTNLLIIFW